MIHPPYSVVGEDEPPVVWAGGGIDNKSNSELISHSRTDLDAMERALRVLMPALTYIEPFTTSHDPDPNYHMENGFRYRRQIEIAVKEIAELLKGVKK